MTAPQPEPVRNYSSTAADQTAARLAAWEGYSWEFMPEHLRQEYRDRVRPVTTYRRRAARLLRALAQRLDPINILDPRARGEE